MLKDVTSMPTSTTQLRAVEWLLYSADANPTKRNSLGHTAVHSALRRNGLTSPDKRSWAVLELLLSGATSDYAFFHTLSTAATSQDGLVSVAAQKALVYACSTLLFRF
jgi:hypothetical protein